MMFQGIYTTYAVNTHARARGEGGAGRMEGAERARLDEEGRERWRSDKEVSVPPLALAFANLALAAFSNVHNRPPAEPGRRPRVDARTREGHTGNDRKTWGHRKTGSSPLLQLSIVGPPWDRPVSPTSTRPFQTRDLCPGHAFRIDEKEESMWNDKKRILELFARKYVKKNIYIYIYTHSYPSFQFHIYYYLLLFEMKVNGVKWNSVNWI